MDGRVVVSNPPPADSPTEDRLEIPELQLVEELRIGVAEGSGPESFGRIAGLETDPEGRIYVADGLAYEIRVFDRTGRHLLSFGGKGRGPVPCA